MSVAVAERPAAKPKDKLFILPESIKERFLQTRGIEYSDGTRVSAAEIWHFMTEEGPRRFPNSFDDGPNNRGRLSRDVEFLSGITRSYLQITLRDRVLEAHDNGVPLVMTQGGQTMEVYYAAGGIPLRPGLVMQWARDMKEGLNFRQAESRGVEILESGRNRISIEACNQIAAHAAVVNGIVPIDLVAPFLALRCSDMAYLVESHRSHPNRKPLQFVDFPVNQVGKPWAVDLVADELRELVTTISKLSGKTVGDDVLFAEIRRANKARRLAREISYAWWDAAQPPTNSVDFYGIFHLANDFVGDPEATIALLEQTRDEVQARVQQGVRGTGVAPDAKRVFICGSCVGPNSRDVEDAGAVIVGRDDSWNLLSQDVKESGDPYRNLAAGILAYPYEQPTEQRAEWTVEAIRRSRADGVIFMYNWGCNYQTGVARLISDIIREKTGLPTTFIEVGELGRGEATEQSRNRVEAFIEMI